LLSFPASFHSVPLFFRALGVNSLCSLQGDELKNCTLPELIEAVTSPAPSHRTLFVLLLTYRSICKPLELIENLISRFENCSADASASVIRLRVVNVIRTWID